MILYTGRIICVAGTGPHGLELGTGVGLYGMDMYVRMGRVDTRCPQDTTVEFGKRRGPLWGTEPHVTSVILDTRVPARSTQNFYIHFNLSFIHNIPNSLKISTLAVTSLPNI